MALFDDRRFLLSHINHSFITGDDTGICEVVMLDEDVFENQHQRCLQFEGLDNENPENRLDPKGECINFQVSQNKYNLNTNQIKHLYSIEINSLRSRLRIRAF